MYIFKTLSVLSALILLSACGKDRPTFASNARLQGDAYDTIAADWDEGQDLIEEGTDLIADGKEMIRDAADLKLEGEDALEEGRQMVTKGEKLQASAEAEYKSKIK